MNLLSWRLSESSESYFGHAKTGMQMSGMLLTERPRRFLFSMSCHVIHLIEAAPEIGIHLLVLSWSWTVTRIARFHHQIDIPAEEKTGAGVCRTQVHTGPNPEMDQVDNRHRYLAEDSHSHVNQALRRMEAWTRTHARSPPV